jgi:hypothetical protein
VFSEICDRLGIEFPIFAFSHCRDVVAAVTNAGGLGVLGATAHSPRALEVDLAWIDSEVDGRPYGVDLLLPAKFAQTQERTAAAAAAAGDRRPPRFPPEHEAFVEDLLTRYGVPPLPEHIQARSGTIRVSPEAAGSLLDVAF